VVRSVNEPVVYPAPVALLILYVSCVWVVLQHSILTPRLRADWPSSRYVSHGDCHRALARVSGVSRRSEPDAAVGYRAAMGSIALLPIEPERMDGDGGRQAITRLCQRLHPGYTPYRVLIVSCGWTCSLSITDTTARSSHGVPHRDPSQIVVLNPRFCSPRRLWAWRSSRCLSSYTCTLAA
jgi:hypothetical protein